MVLINVSERITEMAGIVLSIDPKPVKGDWNGAGAHTNYSTKSMRELGGYEVIKEAIEKLGKRHKEHIAAYGEGNERRLMGRQVGGGHCWGGRIEAVAVGCYASPAGGGGGAGAPGVQAPEPALRRRLLPIPPQVEAWPLLYCSTPPPDETSHPAERAMSFYAQVRRDLKLLLGAGLAEVLNVVFPVLACHKLANTILVPTKRTKKKPGANHSHHQRLLD